jgi:hypothetical protein
MQHPGEHTVRDDAALTMSSLLAILLSSLHVADDIVRGFAKGGVETLSAIPIFAIWLYGTLVLAGRRSGYTIILLGSLLGLVVPVIHMMGRGVGSQIASSEGGLFFAWTLIALGVSALFSGILAVRGLWRMRGARVPPSTR